MADHPPTREAEVEELRKEIPAAWIECCLADFVRLSISRSRIKHLKAVIHLTEGYPAEDIATVQLSSRTLPEALLRKLEVACEREAKAHAGAYHLMPVVRIIVRALEANRFVACADEVAGLKALLNQGASAPSGSAGDQLRIHERSGKVAIRAVEGAYWLEATITIPDQYPDDAPSVEITGTNFDPRIRDICVNNAREIVRRMHEGYDADSALAHQGPPPDKLKPLKEPPPDLSAKGLKQMQHDREFLHSVSQVRGYDNRKIRRHVEHAERKRMEASKDDHSAEATAMAPDEGRRALPSLLTVARYVVEATVRSLPRQKCPLCGDNVLPEEPAAQSAIFGKQSGASNKAQASTGKTIERLYCGHWYHFACLEKFLSQPPFGGYCPCGRRIWLPKFSDQVEKLEKKWAMEQAKQREIGELADLMGME